MGMWGNVGEVFLSNFIQVSFMIQWDTTVLNNLKPHRGGKRVELGGVEWGDVKLGGVKLDGVELGGTIVLAKYSCKIPRRKRLYSDHFLNYSLNSFNYLTNIRYLTNSWYHYFKKPKKGIEWCNYENRYLIN